MARESTEEAQIQELIQASSQARIQLSSKVGRIRRSLDVPAKVYGSLRKKPKTWLLGSMAAGMISSLALGKLPRRDRKSGLRSKLKRKALSLTLTAARPIAKVWLANKLRDLGSRWAHERLAPKPASSPFQVEPTTKPEDVRTPGSRPR